eukprot:PRCOL_00005817-RA
MAELGAHCHGKGRVRVARRWPAARSGTGRDEVREWNVQVLLESDANRVSYTRGDNSPVVATDSIKNSVYVTAKSLVTPTSAEDFAALVAASLLSRYPRHSRVVAEVSEVPWVRANGGVAGDVPHDHGFVSCGAGGVRTVTAEARALSPAMGEVELTSGVRELRVLKSTQSGWEGFVRDGLTMLPPTRERMLASSVRATWTYAAGARRFARGAELPVISPDVSVGCYERLAGDVVRALKGAFYGPPKGGHYSPGVQATLYEMGAAALAATPALANITLAMPNLHFNPCRIGAPVSVVFEDDIFVPVDEPHGMIQATVQRPRARM